MLPRDACKRLHLRQTLEAQDVSHSIKRREEKRGRERRVHASSEPSEPSSVCSGNLVSGCRDAGRRSKRLHACRSQAAVAAREARDSWLSRPHVERVTAGLTLREMVLSSAKRYKSMKYS